MSERGSEIVFRAENMPIRFFKACRWCRRQKMRCDARHQVPCFRCRSTGRDCILDPIEDSRRRSERRRKTTPARGSAVASPLDQRSGFHTPVSREQEYSPVTGQDVSFNASIDSLPDSSTLRELRRSVTADHNGPDSQQLSPSDMIAPVSAVHSMSVNLLDSNNIFMEHSTNSDLRGDIIARGIVTEERARVMYERFTGGSKNYLPLFDPIRDTFDSIRSRSLFCFTVIIYLASRAVMDLRTDTHMQRVLQDEAQRLAEDSFFERPTKLETVQGMILLAAYSEKTWFSTALILRTALDSGLEKSLDTLISQENVPRSSLAASMDDRQLVWQTRTWLISFTLELDVASGTGRKSRIGEVDITKLRKFLDYPLSLPCDMRTVCIIELHQLRGHSRIILDNAGTVRDINWWTTWDDIHSNNGFHAGAFQRSSLKLMLLYARIFVLCATLARIQKLQPTSANSESNIIDQNVMDLWKSLVQTIMEQMAFLITEPAYRCQFPWAPTYPALTIAFDLLLERAEKICDFLKQPPYPDIHRTVSIFVNYARALIVTQRSKSHDIADGPNVSEQGDGSMPSYQGPDSPMENAPPLAPMDDPRYRPGTGAPTDKDPNMVTMPNNDPAAVPRPSLLRLPDTMDAPNWTMSNSIADSFGLFEDGQNDIFDFLPMLVDMANYTLVELSSNEVLVEFQERSTANPNNWSFNKKLYNAVIGLLIVLNSGISSSLPSNAVPTIMDDFDISGDGQKVLPTAIFLIGYCVGPLVFSPMSETIGRQPILFWSFTVFVLGTLACAFAPNWPALLVFRVICGTMAAAPQTVVGGVYADLFSDMQSRGRAMALYMAASSFGPIIGPIISGCSVQYGWRWTFRIDVIICGLAWIGLFGLSETFAPVLLKKQAAKLRKESGSNRYLSPVEVKSDAAFTLTQTIIRPLTMLAFEPIILFTSIYISLAWSMAYPIIFEVGFGAASSCLFALYYDSLYNKAKKMGKLWASGPESQRLPMSCVSAPCLTISLFWLAWSAKSSIPWIVPVLSGIVFGLGYQTTFISLLTYVTDAYKIYSASALAASVIMRSIAGALFPLAADPLYAKLGVAWATSILGFASLACIPIPFALYYYGPWIRKRSPFCQRLLEMELLKGSSGTLTPEEV
ncbi:MFS multidrug transporter [Penicillium angulare]|uniref:MFS multidrug transporter n=1 Tax=Penicillium angulare TaxID=116970 RepID=UPI00253FAE45|nr:MFS multidrug transporter [Penicillium angulare]KAJ5291608.1 MFS multidrug transporter [Penicillium angulare]